MSEEGTKGKSKHSGVRESALHLASQLASRSSRCRCLASVDLQMSASSQGERSLQGKSSCEGPLLWLPSEMRKKQSFEMEPRGDDAFKLKLGAHRPVAGGVLLPFSESKTTRFHRCPRLFQHMSPLIHRKRQASLFGATGASSGVSNGGCFVKNAK